MTNPTKKSWRDMPHLGVHPAADIFPMMSDEELRELGEDIKKNGLHEPIRTFLSDRQYVVDGRNRLDAMELVGIRTIGKDGTLACSYGPLRDGEDPVAFVISANLRRRHLTKQQQAEIIAKAVEASKNDFAKMARSFSPAKGSKGGSTKDPVKAKVVEEAMKHDISPRTAERALAKQRAPETPTQPKRTFVTCPECSGRTADLDKHVATKHKSKSKLQVVKDTGPKDSTGPQDKPPTKKQALNVLKGIAINVDAAADVIQRICDPSTLATYDEAQELIDMVADGAWQLAGYARRFNREREALVARKGGSR